MPRRRRSLQRARCARLSGVTFRRAVLPSDWPGEAAPLDLILLSEVVYYLDAMDVARLAARAGASLAAGGEVVLVHWTGETDYPLSGDEAAERFIAAAAPFAAVTRQQRAARYRLDVLRSRRAASAA
jgi:hypothetical protein